MNKVLKSILLVFLILIMIMTAGIAFMFQNFSWPAKNEVMVASIFFLLLLAVITFFTAKAKTK
jgi:hypothetical protein